MLLLFVNANVIHHVQERGAFVGENAKGAPWIGLQISHICNFY